MRLLTVLSLMACLFGCEKAALPPQGEDSTPKSEVPVAVYTPGQEAAATDVVVEIVVAGEHWIERKSGVRIDEKGFLSYLGAVIAKQRSLGRCHKRLIFELPDSCPIAIASLCQALALVSGGDPYIQVCPARDSEPPRYSAFCWLFNSGDSVTVASLISAAYDCGALTNTPLFKKCFQKMAEGLRAQNEKYPGTVYTAVLLDRDSLFVMDGKGTAPVAIAPDKLVAEMQRARVFTVDLLVTPTTSVGQLRSVIQRLWSAHLLSSISYFFKGEPYFGGQME